MDNEVAELAASLAKPFESCFLKAYWDPHPAGLPTQGWGRLLSRYSLRKHLEEGKTKQEADIWLQTRYPRITQQTADQWLEEDLMKALQAVKRLVKVQLSTNQQAALVDFVFNCGAGNLQISTLLRKINRGEDPSDEFLKWNKAGGVVLKGLTRRRIAERNLWLK